MPETKNKLTCLSSGINTQSIEKLKLEHLALGMTQIFMAKKVNGKQKSIKETLWDSANKLRGTVESSEYKHVVLGTEYFSVDNWLLYCKNRFQ